MPKKSITGNITSTAMDKTVVVSVDFKKTHRVYKKQIKETKKYKARDGMNSKLGGTVVIEECPPLSKTVTWKVVENLTQKESK